MLSTKALHCFPCPVSLILVLGMSLQPEAGPDRLCALACLRPAVCLWLASGRLHQGSA